MDFEFSARFSLSFTTMFLNSPSHPLAFFLSAASHCHPLKCITTSFLLTTPTLGFFVVGVFSDCFLDVWVCVLG